MAIYKKVWVVKNDRDENKQKCQQKLVHTKISTFIELCS